MYVAVIFIGRKNRVIPIIHPEHDIALEAKDQLEHELRRDGIRARVKLFTLEECEHFGYDVKIPV